MHKDISHIVIVLMLLLLSYNLSAIELLTNTKEIIELHPNSSRQCNDGIDNDGDGLVDWQFDLGCYGAEDKTEGGKNNVIENGWSVFEPAYDTRIIYVSSSTGNDKWSGLAPIWNGVDGPKKTISSSKKSIRKNHSDWLLFKRGDTWFDETMGNWDISGRSATEPVIIASYGNSPIRPKFMVSDTFFIARGGGGASKNRKHIRLLGLHIKAYTKDPAHPQFTGKGGACIQWLRDGGDFLIEDVKCEFAQVSLQSKPTLGFSLRRNVFTQNYSIDSHAQSLFTSIGSNLLIEENVFNHGGWNDDFRLVLFEPERNHKVWNKIRNGCFDILLEDNRVGVENIDFMKSSNMIDVAKVIENKLNSIKGGRRVRFVYTQGGVFKLSSKDYKSGHGYRIREYTGKVKCENISSLFNPSKSGTPSSTVFNRNMYLAFGMGNTIVRGNIDANGASGGVQQRMGGINDNNLYIKSPISIVFGSKENPSGKNIGGVIKNNVVLGSRDINTQPQGTGIFIESNLKLSSLKAKRYSRISNLDVYNNIIINNEEGSGNIKAIALAGNAYFENLQVHHNIIYNWLSSKDNNSNSYNIAIYNNSKDTKNTSVHHNYFYCGRSKLPRVQGRIKLFNNVTLGLKKTLSSAKCRSNKTVNNKFIDPNRTISTYMASLGENTTYELFISKAVGQSKYNWSSSYTANAVNQYIRAGFKEIN